MDPGDPGTFAALLALGAGAGFASTLFGIGGGILVVPVLAYLMGVDFRTATALALLAMVAHPPFGVWQHARRGAVDWRLALLLAGGGAFGVACGILLAPHVPVPHLKLLFAAVMAAAAWRLVAKTPEVAPHAPGAAPVLALGALGGVASRLLGIGGGLVTVPVLAFLGVRIHAAVGSSLVAVFTNAALASAVSLQAGLDWRPAVPIALGAVAATALGTRTAHGLKSKPLATLFAGALALAAAYVALTSGAF